mgnify:CR=1 FL=1
MELISFLNDQFWGESSYMVLFVISIVLILWGKRKNDRAKLMAIYSITVLLFVIYNPLVAPIGLKFFTGDPWSYMRIFYLLPLMPLIAYVLSDYYADMVEVTEKTSKKVLVLCIICITVVISGRVYDKSMYVKAQNIYKVDEQALEIAETVLDVSGEEKARVVLPNNENIIFGIRQYTGDIIVSGYSDGIVDESSLAAADETMDFSYIVITKDKSILRMFERNNYIYLNETDDYFILQKSNME